MPAGSPDLVDCALLAQEATVLERVYALRELPRLRELLAQPVGSLSVKYAFASLGGGRTGATVTFEAAPELVCQRCLQEFRLDLSGSSEVEFAGDAAAESDSEREFFTTKGGLVSLRELAEEEMLLALPIAPACSTPLTCGKAPDYSGDEAGRAVDEMRRPFSALQDLLKKT